MAKIVRTSEAAAIGLHAALLLAASPDRCLSTAEISNYLKVSVNHCSKVMQRLTRAGIVKAVRGPKGGFRLARPPEEIGLLEVYESIDGTLSDAECLFSEPHCRMGECILSGMFEEVNRVIRSYLGPASLADVLSTKPEHFKVLQQTETTI
ncbi:MAG: RrF2 family transcriptional regulator [Verrucomicrobiota bacterium]